MEDAAPKTNIFVTTTNNLNVITVDHMRKMKNHTIIYNINHFNTKIQTKALRNFK